MNMDAAFFYEGGGRRAAVDAMFDGIHHDGAVVLLVGPTGCGRSAVVGRFCAEADPDVISAGLVVGDILMSADQCCLALAASLGSLADAPSEAGADIENREGISRGDNAQALLHDVFAGIRASGRAPVVIVDDAHELGEEARDSILDICRAASVSLVLSGDESLPGLLAGRPDVSTITLRAFTGEETEDFVAGWLAIGDEDELPSHRAMARIHRQSGGMPARLAALLQSGATMRTSLLPAGFPVWHLAFTAVAVVLLLLLLVRADPEPAAAPIAVTAEIPVTLPPPGDAAGGSALGVVPLTRSAAIAVPQPVVAGKISPEEPTKPPASTAPAAIPPAVLPAPAMASKAPVLVPAPVREPQRIIRKYSVDEEALLKEKSSRFTLQLFASFNEDAEHRFRAHHTGITVRTFRTSREDLPWYVAVTGVYRNKDEARAAVAKLPADVQKLKPWPRSLQGIQDELRRRKD